MTVLSPPRPAERRAESTNLELPPADHPGWAALLADLDSLA